MEPSERIKKGPECKPLVVIDCLRRSHKIPSKIVRIVIGTNHEQTIVRVVTRKNGFTAIAKVSDGISDLVGAACLILDELLRVKRS